MPGTGPRRQPSPFCPAQGQGRWMTCCLLQSCGSAPDKLSLHPELKRFGARGLDLLLGLQDLQCRPTARPDHWGRQGTWSGWHRLWGTPGALKKGSEMLDHPMVPALVTNSPISAAGTARICLFPKQKWENSQHCLWELLSPPPSSQAGLDLDLVGAGGPWWPGQRQEKHPCDQS